MLGPHSPFAVGIVRSQSGKKSTSLSPHVRWVLVETVLAGLFSRAMAMDSCCTPRLALPLMAVLPLPKRSYATETRGLTSFQFGTFSTAAKVTLRLGSHRCGPIVKGSVDVFR